MAEGPGPTLPLLRWCGLALVPAGVLMAVATVLHPSRETAATIIATEVGLVAAHFLYTLAWLLVLLGLPGLYASQRRSMGRLGLAGFLAAFSGTYLIAVTGNFGFFAPVMAKEAPATLNAIEQYSPVVVINGLAAILFMIGYLLFGIAMFRARVLARWAAALLAIGTVGTAALAVLPESFNRPFAVPVGVALIGLGLSLWRSHRDDTAPATATASTGSPSSVRQPAAR